MKNFFLVRERDWLLSHNLSYAFLSNSFTRIALVLLVVHYISQAVFHTSRILHCAGKSEVAQHGYVNIRFCWLQPNSVIDKYFIYILIKIPLLYQDFLQVKSSKQSFVVKSEVY